MSLTLRQLKYFVAAAELGQISQAAIQLAISQSAVTTAIRELEEIVGSPLFQRSASGVALTETGRGFLNHAYNILSSVDEALRMPSADARESGRLLLAASYTVIGYFLPYHLQRLSQLYPNLDIQLHEAQPQRHRGRPDRAPLRNGGAADLERGESGTGGRALLRLAAAAVVPARHALLARDTVTLEDVAHEPFIMLTVDEAAHTALRYWSETPFRPDVRLRTSSVEAVRSMVANGGGVAVLSDMVYRPWSLEGRRIETIQLKDPIPPMNVGLAWRKGADITGPMRAVRDYFRHAYAVPRGTDNLR
ncbi:LysR family transcriptional regulator [Achromobacter insuavis]